ncbi:MAG: 6-carboxytetrahydropterin synthase [Pseudomonadota bacterium]|nr:6-carboxytetrahydropterin synthase [Pseudomonadota bacterium]
MYELKIRDYCFIAHSLKDEFFGPAKNLHGVTYVIDLVISSENLIEKNIIIDIGVATDILKKVISKYNYKNLDDVDELKDDITTTEFMAKHLTDKVIQELDNLKYPVKKLYSVGIILKENHLASASYTKLI